MMATAAATVTVMATAMPAMGKDDNNHGQGQ